MTDSPPSGARDPDGPDGDTGVPAPMDAQREPIMVGGRQIPPALALATGLAWRGLLLAAAVATLGFLVAQLSLLVIPIVIALIVSALLAPVARLVSRIPRMPGAVATGVVVIGGLAAVGAIVYWIVIEFVAGLPDLSNQLGQSLMAAQRWLADGPLHVDDARISSITNDLLGTLQRNQAELAGNVVGAVGTAGEFLTEALLTLFVLIFFIHDGARIWNFLLGCVPRGARTRADVAGRRAFASLVGYTRAIVVVAAVDAITAGVGLWLIGVPLPVPLAILIFFGAFVPTLGAVVTGAVAVLIALVTGGWLDAVLVIALLIAVQNIEGYILQPLLLGRSVQLHPLAVVLPIAGGLVIAGIPGALLAVPLVTLADAGVRSMNRASDRALTDPSTIDPLNPHSARPDVAHEPPAARKAARRALRKKDTAEEGS